MSDFLPKKCVFLDDFGDFSPSKVLTGANVLNFLICMSHLIHKVDKDDYIQAF